MAASPVLKLKPIATTIDYPTMADTFLTVAGPSEAVFTEKRSKFLAFAWPVKTAAQAP